MKILCYHGVSKIKKSGIINFNKKHILVNDFENQIRLIKRKYIPITIDHIYFNLKNKIPFNKKMVCITFDDGFENNFTTAAKILLKYQVPAMFYICPGTIEKKEMFWVDKIEAAICFTKKKNVRLNLKKNIQFDLSTDKKKIRVIEKIKQYCKSVSDKKKDIVIKNLIEITGVIPSNKMNKNYKVASWDQIKKTLKNKLFSLGGHSFEHSILTKLTNKQVDKDIKKTISLILKRTGVLIRHFSYPEGKKNKKVINIMKKNKILSCPLAFGTKNTHNVNPFLLERIMVGFKDTKFPLKK